MEINIREGYILFEAIKYISMKYNLNLNLGQMLEILQYMENKSDILL